MKKVGILLVFLALPFTSCQTPSATSADLLKALSAIVKHEKDTSFVFPDSEKAMMREVSHYEENAGTSASVVNDSTSELAYDTTASYCRNSGDFSNVSGSDSSGQSYAHYLYKAADGRYLNPVVFSAQKTYTVLEKADFDTQYAQMLSDTKTPIEEQAKMIYGWIEWTVNYGMSSSSNPFSYSGMTCQSVSFSDITIRSEGNLTFTETLDISAGDKNTHNVYTFEFASYLPKSLLQKGTQVSSESTSISTATDETTFSWGECTLIYPDLSSYSLASPGTGGFF